MKLTANTEALTKSLNRVGIAIAAHGFLPVLGSFKIEAQDGIITLSATNLDLFVTDKISDCKIKEPGGVVVAYAMLKNFIGRATAVETKMQSSEKLLSVKHGENHGSFEILPIDEFPAQLKASNPKEIKCAAEDLLTPLKKVSHAMSEDQSRYALQGVNVHRNKAATEFRSTDGFRLSVFKSDIPFEGDIIIPAMAVRAIIKTIESGEVGISHDANVIIIKSDTVEIGSRLIEAKFPACHDLIPPVNDRALSAQREELISAVSTAAVFLKNNEVGVQLTGDKKELKVSCLDRFQTKLIGAELSTQADTAKSFNYRYLLDALNVHTADAVRLECPPDRDLVAIRDGAWVEVINPLRLPTDLS